MGVGRNLSYQRSLFFENKGFACHQHIMSGDDDLLLMIQPQQRIFPVQINPDSFTYSQPKTDFIDCSVQKNPTYISFTFIKFKHKMLLGIYYFFVYLFLVLFF